MCIHDGGCSQLRNEDCIIQGGEIKGCEMGGTCSSEERGDKMHGKKKCSQAAVRGRVGFLESWKIMTGCNVETRNAWKNLGCHISVRAVLYPVSGVFVGYSFRLFERGGRGSDSGTYQNTA